MYRDAGGGTQAGRERHRHGGEGHDPRVWPYGRDVNATKKSRLGRYEHRFLIRGPIQVSDGPVDGVPVAAYSHHQVHRRQDYGGGPDQGGTPPWDYRTRTPHSPPPSRDSAHRCWGPMYTAVLVASPPPGRAPSGPATGVPHWLFIVEV